MPDPANSRTIAIGDIHGCSLALEALLRAIEIRGSDTVVTLGDYIDRGGDSRGVIDQILDLRQTCNVVSLLGNHELMLCEVLAGADDGANWLACGGQATLASYSGSLDNIPPSHRQFLDSLRHFYELDDYFFVHANYYYDMALEEQPETMLFWEHLHRSPPRPHVNGKVAIVGHTPQLSGEILRLGEHLVGIDTFCCGGQWLTAYEVRSGQIWQANKRGEVRKL